METAGHNLEEYRSVHLIGIGGIGMSGIAEYLAGKGVTVSGSDIRESITTRRLERIGVKVILGHAGENIPDDCELVIYTSALDEENAELKRAKAIGTKLIKRAEALGNIVNKQFLIAVSGTHGKTTTTAMIAKVLIDADVDPTVFVGGALDFFEGGSSKIGNGDVAVVEADEYDRSFLRLSPDILVITNIDSDHLDIYRDMNDIIDNFKMFLAKRKKSAKVIACGDDKDVLAAIRDIKDKVTYGFDKGNNFAITDMSFDGSKSDYTIDGNMISLKVPGAHNVLNSAACYLTARELKLSVTTINESLRDFRGVHRRLELKYENGLLIYDDYAHHPAEVKASLDAMKRLKHDGRIITVFQPHLFTRTRDFYKEFAEAFQETDILFLAKIYPAREKEIEGVSSRLILNEYFKMGKNGIYIEKNEELLDTLEDMTKDGDIVVFQGAGDITGVCEKFVARLNNKRATSVPL
jgi:UDP-N-acetylmuramate--alanine ligase